LPALFDNGPALLLKEKSMNRMLLVLLSIAIAGCSTLSPEGGGQASAAPVAQHASTEPIGSTAVPSERNSNLVVATDAGGPVVIRKLEFRQGLSSATVERLAKQSGCNGSGAGLVTEKGPVEVYRMQCDNGRTFLAKCEQRQCKPMR
jgi:hypothetical protein